MSLNLALVITGDASGAKRAATETATAVQTLGRETRNTSAAQTAAANANRQAEASHRTATDAIRGETMAQRDLTAAVLQFSGVKLPTGDSGLRARAADMEAYGSALDQIRAKHVPLFAVQRQYGDQLKEIAAAARVGAISEDERAAASMRAKAAYDLQVMSLSRGGASTKLAAHEVQNLSYQMNDVAMMLMSGQSFGILMAQQGGQIAQIFGRRGLSEIIPAVGAGIASLVSPTTIALAGITALYYGASMAFSGTRDEVVKTDEALEKHEAAIKRVDAVYEGFSDRLSRYRDRAQLLGAVTRENLALQEAAARAENKTLIDQFIRMREFDSRTSRVLPRVDTEMKPFEEAILRLDGEIAKGNPNFEVFVGHIERIVATDPENLRKIGDKILLAGENAFKAQAGVDAARQAVNEIGSASELAAERVSAFIDQMENLSQIGKPQLSDTDQAAKVFEDILKNAPSFEAAEAAAAEYEKTLKRIREAQEIATLRENGGIPIPAPNREDALPSANDVLRGQEERLQFLQLEAQLIGASDAVRARLIARLEAEQDLRRRGIDMASAEAQAVLANADAIASAEAKIDSASRAWERFRSAGESAIDNLVDKLADGDIEGALEGLAKDFGKFLLEMNVSNPLKNAAFNSGLPTMDDLGGLSGILARLFGGADRTAESAIGQIAGQAVGAMNVTAGTVMINGGVGALNDLLGGAAGQAGNVTRLLSPANSNVSPEDLAGAGLMNFMPGTGGAIGGSFLDLIGRAEGTDRGRGYNETLGYGAFTGGDRNLTGMTLDEVDALQRQMLAHPGNHFNSSAVGRYQITGRTMRGLRGEMGLRGDELYDEGMQDRMALRLAERRGPNVAGLRNEWEGLRGVDPSEILKAYEGTSDAVLKLGKVTLPAVDNLDLFGTGLGDIGKSLGSAMPSGEGVGGGILSLIMKLLGGIGGIPGFEDGTEGAPGGWSWVGERGPELRKLRQGDVIRSHQRSREMVAEGARGNLSQQEFGPIRSSTQVNFTSTVINNADVEVTRKQEEDGAGGWREEILIEQRVDAALSRRGSAANRTLRQGGFRQRGPLR